MWEKFSCHGPLARYAKLRVAHAPGMPGTFSPPPRVSDPDMHYGTCVTHVPWCMPGSLTSGFLWSWWRGKRSRHSRRMRNPQFYASGKRPMTPSFYALHYNDVIMSMIASKITSLTFVYSTVYLGADQRKHRSSASLAFVLGIHRGPVNSSHKWPVTRKMFPFDDVIMYPLFCSSKFIRSGIQLTFLACGRIYYILWYECRIFGASFALSKGMV